MATLSLKPLFEKTEAVRVSPAEDLPVHTSETTPTALTTTRIVTAKTIAEDTTAFRSVIMYFLWRSFQLIPLSESKRFEEEVSS
jgi:hypothetical protein